MTSTESQKPTREDFARWGTAPEDRQCRYEFANGYHCRRWSIRGHEFCHEHGRWMATRVDGPMDVPLVEDPAAVQLVASQTIRALAWGHIPPANGRAILHGCRVIQTGFAQQLAEARFRLKCHRLSVDANQFLPARSPAEPAPSETNPEGAQSRVPHLSPVFEEVGQAGAPFKPDVGLSGLETSDAEPGAPFKPSSGLSGLDKACHPSTLNLQACIDPHIEPQPPLPKPPVPFSRSAFLPTTSGGIRGIFSEKEMGGCPTLVRPRPADRVDSLTRYRPRTTG